MCESVQGTWEDWHGSACHVTKCKRGTFTLVNIFWIYPHAHTFKQAAFLFYFFDCFSVSVSIKKGKNKKSPEPLSCFAPWQIQQAHTGSYTHQSQLTRRFYNKNWIPFLFLSKTQRMYWETQRDKFQLRGRSTIKHPWHTHSRHAGKIFIIATGNKRNDFYEKGAFEHLAPIYFSLQNSSHLCPPLTEQKR